MKVRDFIKKLQEYDEDMELCIWDTDIDSGPCYDKQVELKEEELLDWSSDELYSSKVRFGGSAKERAEKCRRVKALIVY